MPICIVCITSSNPPFPFLKIVVLVRVMICTAEYSFSYCSTFEEIVDQIYKKVNWKLGASPLKLIKLIMWLAYSSPRSQISHCSSLGLACSAGSKMAVRKPMYVRPRAICFANCSVSKVILKRVCLQDGFCTNVWFILGHSLAVTRVTEPVVMQHWEAMDELLKEFQL